MYSESKSNREYTMRITVSVVLGHRYTGLWPDRYHDNTRMKKNDNINEQHFEKNSLKSSILVWDNREPFGEHVLGVVLRFQALQTWVIATE
jgi:hypothetical protein